MEDEMNAITQIKNDPVYKFLVRIADWFAKHKLV